MTQRQERATRSKTEIYEAALALFKEKGFEATTIKDIAAAAGVSVGNVYHYFESKNDVLVENFRRADEAFKSLVERGVLAHEGPEGVVDYLVEYARLVERTGLNLSKHLYTYRTKLFIKPGRPMQAELEGKIAEWQDRGLLASAVPAEEICRHLFVAARGLILDWCLREGEGDLAKEMEVFVRRLVVAFAPA